MHHEKEPIMLKRLKTPLRDLIAGAFAGALAGAVLEFTPAGIFVTALIGFVLVILIDFKLIRQSLH
jgi:uncharacterized membrane protein YeaQ/YmgE (transglycosylase-associated protein family)